VDVADSSEIGEDKMSQPYVVAVTQLVVGGADGAAHVHVLKVEDATTSHTAATAPNTPQVDTQIG
jgi:hypothetical protein